MTMTQNKNLLITGTKAFNNIEDRSGWLEIHDQSVIAHGLAPEPLDFDGVGQFYSGLWKAFPDLQIEAEDVIEEGDKIAVRLTAKGTHQAEFRGVPATGKEITFSAQYIFRFGEGKIVERWTIFDRLGVMAQLGAISIAA